MKDYIMIKKTDIFIVSTIRYSGSKNNLLVIDKNYVAPDSKIVKGLDSKIKCYMRKVLYKNNHFIDIETGEELFLHRDDDGLVEPPIYKNTTYIVNIYIPESVSSKDLLNAFETYKLFVEKEKLIKEKKLVLFPQERIY